MAQIPNEDEPVSFEAQYQAPFPTERPELDVLRFRPESDDDVSAHADAIASRLRDGTMPCDGAWPGPQVERSAQRWIDSGKPR